MEILNGMIRNPWLRMLFFCTSFLSVVHAQATSRNVRPILEQRLQNGAVTTAELQQFLMERVPRFPNPKNGKQWEQQSKEIREHAFSILYHGWPKEWIDAAPKFERVGVIERRGYRIVKLRFEVVPGFSSTALLYEPDRLSGRVPAILNVNGHGEGGKAVEHKQKRCINQARRGIIALSLEWFDYGELKADGNDHQFLRLLDLAGVNGLGLFYLEMRRGIDYLASDPEVDPMRIGVTGLSGGGWQTILLSGLDERVGPAAPVAGFSSLTTAIEHPEYAGDEEQNASDFRLAADYPWLAAARAPRPTLLMFNDMDDCCFRAGVVKQGVYSDVKPLFGIVGGADKLEWYENQDPGTHNYQVLSRERAYGFFDRQFHLNVSPNEYPDTDVEVRSYAELAVGLPENNLTILGLAQAFARSVRHTIPAPRDPESLASRRSLLRQDVRYAPVSVSHACVIEATHTQGFESHSYKFQFSNGLSATGVLFQGLDTQQPSGTTILLDEHGMPSTVDEIIYDVARGKRVLVLEPLFFGQNVPDRSPLQFHNLLNTMGERPLGLEAAQLVAVVRWLGENLDHGSPSPGSIGITDARPNAVLPVTIITNGARAEIVATVAAAIQPDLLSKLELRNSISSLLDLFNQPRLYLDAPEVACLDLFRDFDFDILRLLAAPVEEEFSAPIPEKIVWG